MIKKKIKKKDQQRKYRSPQRIKESDDEREITTGKRKTRLKTVSTQETLWLPNQFTTFHNYQK